MWISKILMLCGTNVVVLFVWHNSYTGWFKVLPSFSVLEVVLSRDWVGFGLDFQAGSTSRRKLNSLRMTLGGHTFRQIKLHIKLTPDSDKCFWLVDEISNRHWCEVISFPFPWSEWVWKSVYFYTQWISNLLYYFSLQLVLMERQVVKVRE